MAILRNSSHERVRAADQADCLAIAELHAASWRPKAVIASRWWVILVIKSRVDSGRQSPNAPECAIEFAFLPTADFPRGGPQTTNAGSTRRNTWRT